MKETLDYLNKKLEQIDEFNYDADRDTLVFRVSGNEQVLEDINSEATIEVEILGNDAEIDLGRLPFYFYIDEPNFLRKTGRNNWGKPSYIHSSKAWYNPSDQTTEVGGKPIDDYFLLLNNHQYFLLLIFLKSQEHQEDAIFYFVDHFSWDSRLIVLTTLKKEGKLSINFPTGGLELIKDLKLKVNYQKLVSAFSDQSKHFPKFIKNEMVGQLSKFDKPDRIIMLLEKMGEILNVAEQNFEIYLHDLSLENLKKDYIDQKNKYFTQLREILSKLTNQIIALPITIAASLFGSYKVSDSNLTLVLILFVFILYALFSIFLLKLQREDVCDIRKSLESEFDQLASSKFFVSFPKELKAFKIAKNQIKGRIQNLVTGIDAYYIFFSLGVLVFIAYLLMLMKMGTWPMAICLLILTLVFAAIFRLIVNGGDAEDSSS